MFSIENLLSNKYTSKSLQRQNSQDSADSSDPKLANLEASKRKEHATEVNVFAEKRDMPHFGQIAVKDRSNGIGAGEICNDRTGEHWSRISTKVRRARKRRSDGESCSESDSERDSESEEGRTLNSCM